MGSWILGTTFFKYVDSESMSIGCRTAPAMPLLTLLIRVWWIHAIHVTRYLGLLYRWWDAEDRGNFDLVCGHRCVDP